MAAPYIVDIDPQAAQQLAQAGAALLLLDVPAGSYLGVDHQGFTVGPRFKGIKMLPPGPHFVSYRSVSAQGDSSFTTSFFIHLSKQEVVVKRWDVETETLINLSDEDEASRLAAGVRRFEFDASLAPYDLRSYAQWCQLSARITASVIDKLAPVGGAISITAEADDPELLEPQTEGERRLVQQLQEGRAKRMIKQQLAQCHQDAAGQGDGLLRGTSAAALIPACTADQPAASGMDIDNATLGSNPTVARASEQGPGAGTAAPGVRAGQGMDVDRGLSVAGTSGGMVPPAAATRWGRCFYSRLPRLIKTRGATAAELTSLNMDKSAVLEKVVAERYGGQAEDLLGELQFAFIAFVFGQSLDGFAQWKSLLLLLLGCEEAAVRGRPGFFTEVLRALGAQLALTAGVQQPQRPPPPASTAGAAAGTAAATPSGVPLIEEMLPDSFLRRAFEGFFSGLQDSHADVPSDLATEASRLKRLLRQVLGWEYDLKVMGSTAGGGQEEDDEYAPQIVEL